MRLAQITADARLAATQAGLAPPIADWSDRIVQSAQAARRRTPRRRYLALAALAMMILLSAIFWPPRHGALWIATTPWADNMALEHRIQRAGGVVIGGESGAVRVLGLRVGQVAIGADPSFRGEMLSGGRIVLSAEPLYWIGAQFTALKGAIWAD